MAAAMGSITAVILAAFLGYAAAWYTGAVQGNFALLLMLAVIVTGLYWVAERLVFLPRRKQAAERLVQEHQRTQGIAAQAGVQRGGRRH